MTSSTPFVAGHRSRTQGFSLIELMVAVTIVAILSAIAYPSYRNYVLRGQVVSATNNLSAWSANLERWYQDNRTYVGGPCGLSAGGVSTTYGTFTVSCSALTASAFTLQAIGQNATNGFKYTIDNTGVQGTSIASPAPSTWIITCSTSWSTKEGSC
jgi:type IV pilus assembly protein PilE